MKTETSKDALSRGGGDAADDARNTFLAKALNRARMGFGQGAGA